MLMVTATPGTVCLRRATFHHLLEADHLIVARSAFSWVAAFLSTHQRVYATFADDTVLRSFAGWEQTSGLPMPWLRPCAIPAAAGTSQ